MYSFFIVLHSFIRWIVLFILLYSLYRSCRGLVLKRSFNRLDHVIRSITVSIVHMQFAIGVFLYFKSPIVGYFLRNFSEAVHVRDLRFFGMEHITMMVLAVASVTIGSISAKRKRTDREKFRTIVVWFSIALFIIFISIPWPFSPFTSRPYIRSF